MTEHGRWRKRTLPLYCVGLLALALSTSGCSLDARSRSEFEVAYAKRVERRDFVHKEYQRTVGLLGDVNVVRESFDAGLGRTLTSPEVHRENWMRRNPLPPFEAPDLPRNAETEFSERQLERLQQLDKDIASQEKLLESARRSLHTYKYYQHFIEEGEH